MILAYRVERQNERWWAASAQAPGHSQRLQGYGATRVEAVERIKEIVVRALLMSNPKVEKIDFAEEVSSG